MADEVRADYSRFNLTTSTWVPNPGGALLTNREKTMVREHAKAVRKQVMKKVATIRKANNAALSTPLLAALWAFFDKEGEGWAYARQDGTEVTFDGTFDLKNLAAAIEEVLK